MDTHCVQTKEQLLQCITQLNGLCSSFIDSVYPLQDNLREVAGKLAREQPSIHVALIGTPDSGKSTLMRAVTAQDMLPTLPATGRLEIRHRVCGEPVLLSVDQQASLAMEADGVKTYLQNNMAAGSSLQLDVQFPCFGEEHFSELPLSIVEYPAETRLSKCIRMSKTSYQAVQWWMLCDVLIYVIDYSLLKSAKEKTIFSELKDPANPAVVPNMTERMFFVVNKVDPLIAEELKISNIHDHCEAGKKFRDKEDLRHYVGVLINNTLGFRPQTVQIAVVSSLHALYSRIVQSKKHPPTVRQLYDFAEMVRGSAYMQTIDDLTDEDLLLECRGHSYQSEPDSGIQEFEAQLVIIAANRGRMMLSSCFIEAIHYTRQYERVLEQALPLLAEESQHKSEVQKALQQECDYIDVQLQKADEILQTVTHEMQSIFMNSFDDFWFQRITELQAAFDGMGEMHFKSRQATGIYEIQRELKIFRQFLPRYERDRSYLEKKRQEQQEIEQAKQQELNNTTTTPASLDQSVDVPFVNNHIDDILSVLEKERYQLLVSVCSVICHHIKDELQVLSPSLDVSMVATRRALLDAFHREAENMISHTETSTGESFGLEDFTNNICDVPLLINDEKRLNNYMREIPEQVADILFQLIVSPSPTDQELALMRAWRIFANKANPCDFITFDHNKLWKIMDKSTATLERLVGAYQLSLKKGVEQEMEDIAQNTQTGGEVEHQKHQLPMILELMVSLQNELTARNVFSVHVIEVQQQKEKAMVGIEE